MVKQTTTCLLLILLLAGCSTQNVQLYKTASVGIDHSDNTYNYQNDTIGVDYTFWADAGQMCFRFYNKSSRPIYIDWKKSSYVSNSYKFDYWSDKTQTTTLSSNVSRSFAFKDSISFPKIVGYSSIGMSLGNSTSTTSKIERITFLPPKSYIIRYFPKSLMEDYYHFVSGDKNYTQKVEVMNPIISENTTVSSKLFTKESSPLDFRNFMTLSFKEDFSSEFYVDNEFYISEVVVMDSRHFAYYQLDRNTNESQEIMPYKKRYRLL